MSGPLFSPNSQRLAYAAGLNEDQHVVVLDGRESPPYAGIKPATLAFSPDSRRLAYGARSGKQWTVVVDGQSGTLYDTLLSIGGGKLIFDASDRLHYLAARGADISLVSERLQ